MNYYDEIKSKILKCEIYDKIKNYSKDRNKIKNYFEIGKILSEVGKEYGKNIIKEYSNKLTIEIGKKYNERNLRYMRKFYELFVNQNWNTMCSNLTWSQYLEVLSLGNFNEIKYYLEECENKNLSVRELHFKIKTKEYERLSKKVKQNLEKTKKLKIDDLIPNPIIIKSNTFKDELSEYALKEVILNDLDSFLKELGTGFSYVGNEYKIKIGDRYNYIDLLLFNYEFNCFVVVELKVTELKKEHIGQIEFYMNFIDKNLKNINQNKTIGIIICKKENKYVIEYCSDDRIIAREYELV